jgi:hypothetical protein
VAYCDASTPPFPMSVWTNKACRVVLKVVSRFLRDRATFSSPLFRRWALRLVVLRPPPRFFVLEIVYMMREGINLHAKSKIKRC